MRYLALVMLLSWVWACGGTAATQSQDISEIKDMSGPDDVSATLDSDSGAESLETEDADAGSDFSVEAGELPDSAAHDGVPTDQFEELSVPEQCYEFSDFEKTACKQHAKNCKTLKLTWGRPLELRLCLSDTILHESGCGQFDKSDLIIDWRVALVDTKDIIWWTGALVEAELWEESGMFLKTLTFVKPDIDPCPLYVLNGEDPYCTGRVLSLDSGLLPMTDCPAIEEYYTIFGGCRTKGYVKTPNGLGGFGIRVHLPAGRYEVRLVFFPEYASGPASWPPDRCLSSVAEGFLDEYPWPAQQEYIAIPFEVVK